MNAREIINRIVIADDIDSLELCKDLFKENESSITPFDAEVIKNMIDYKIRYLFELQRYVFEYLTMPLLDQFKTIE